MLARRPLIFSQFQNLVVGESTRHGGVSAAPFHSLNMGLSSGDERSNVLENRQRFFQSLGADTTQVALAHQVHGCDVLVADKPGNYQAFDAIICNQQQLYIAVSIADCTPILIYDPVREAVAAIHAGWRGTVAGIVTHTLAEMQRHFGTQPSDCYAYVGTCIDADSFEVDEDVSIHFEDIFKRFDSSKNKYYIDLKAANSAQLQAAGLPLSQIGISPYSTVLNNDDYFSYRKEAGKTGRMLALIGMK